MTEPTTSGRTLQISPAQAPDAAHQLVQLWCTNHADTDAALRRIHDTLAELLVDAGLPGRPAGRSSEQVRVELTHQAELLAAHLDRQLAGRQGVTLLPNRGDGPEIGLIVTGAERDLLELAFARPRPVGVTWRHARQLRREAVWVERAAAVTAEVHGRVELTVPTTRDDTALQQLLKTGRSRRNVPTRTCLATYAEMRHRDTTYLIRTVRFAHLHLTDVSAHPDTGGI